METQKLPLLLFCFILSSLLSEYQGVEASSIFHHRRRHHHHHHSDYQRDLTHTHSPPKLFVFGDSYADTGNNRISVARSWKHPYGVTFPGKPAGRYSNGRVMTDFLARFFGTKSPIAYNLRKYAPQRVWYGMNFAFGGTGVFETLVSDPNMTLQIDFFQDLVRDAVYDAADLNSSVALVSLAGNDYSAYNANGGSTQGLPAFIAQVVTQLTVNIKHIHNIGVKKVAVTALQPIGCLPQFTVAYSFQQCSETNNVAVNYHNLLLRQAVAKLNNGTADSPFAIVDLNTAFTTVLNNTEAACPGSTTFVNPLKPCCMGINSNYTCGGVDEKGEKMYTVCDDPKSAFFWDQFHPTQAGWRAVFSTLRKNLEEIYY